MTSLGKHCRGDGVARRSLTTLIPGPHRCAREPLCRHVEAEPELTSPLHPSSHSGQRAASPLFGLSSKTARFLHGAVDLQQPDPRTSLYPASP